jgi:PIN domain
MEVALPARFWRSSGSTGSPGICGILWLPKLPDIKDDMVLEAAVNGQCQTIVTWNVRDFAAAADFGIQVLSPDAFLNLKKEVKP